MYGPPGTGKTLLARACAAQTDATFLKLAGPQLVQMFIGDGAKLVRDCFALAKEKAPSIIFIDELDAVGTKRFDSEKSGDREVQRTMLELLNQLDGFASDDRVKVLAATNRVDVLDPALLRSGRLDRKIEFPLPNEEARAQILKIHSRKMTVDDAVNWPELARSTDEFGGAQLKAVCVEAGMIALRKGMVKIGHEHYVDAIAEVQAKKKVSFPSKLELPRAKRADMFVAGHGQFLRLRALRMLVRHRLGHDLAEGEEEEEEEEGEKEDRQLSIHSMAMARWVTSISLESIIRLDCEISCRSRDMAVLLRRDICVRRPQSPRDGFYIIQTVWSTW